jgi:hypothetical protein
MKIINYIANILNNLKNFCKTYQKIHEYKLLYSCILNDSKNTETLLKTFNYEQSFLNLCLENSTVHGHVDICKLLIENNAKNINKCLEISSKNNNSSLIELFIRKGGDSTIALTKCKSQNIINLVHKLEEELNNKEK